MHLGSVKHLRGSSSQKSEQESAKDLTLDV